MLEDEHVPGEASVWTQGGGRAFERDLVQPSFAVFWRLLVEQVDASLGSVGETNLHRGVSEAAVQRLAAHADVRLVFCMTSREVSVRRFIERFERGERHWCFDDGRRQDLLGQVNPIHRGTWPNRSARICPA